jgi:hypothetical protein
MADRHVATIDHKVNKTGRKPPQMAKAKMVVLAIRVLAIRARHKVDHKIQKAAPHVAMHNAHLRSNQELLKVTPMEMRLDPHILMAIKTFLKLHVIRLCPKPDYLHHLAKIANRVITLMVKAHVVKMPMAKIVVTAVTVAQIVIQVAGNVMVVAVLAKSSRKKRIFLSKTRHESKNMTQHIWICQDYFFDA